MIITRFAPSPTGNLHIGGARTALFNFLYSKNQKGKFLLRIEDTDKERSKKEFETQIIQSLNWLGIINDENIIYQSNNLENHKKIAQELLGEKLAYKCYCTSEELEKKREIAIKNKINFLYDGKCRNIQEETNKPYVIRFKVEHGNTVKLRDGVQGDVDIESNTIEDFVILRADGTPTYNLSAAIDDKLMGITHVIRGDDHKINAIKQILIFQALNWQLPKYFHIPLIHSEEGKKLSKRDNASTVEDYKKIGILPQALRNYLLRLGWSYKDKEIFSDEESIKFFTLKNIGKSPSKLDFSRILSINEYYIKNMDNELLKEYFKKYIKEYKNDLEDKYINIIVKNIQILKNKSKTLEDIYLNSNFIYSFEENKDDYSEKTKSIIKSFVNELKKINNYNEVQIKELTDKIINEYKISFKELGQPLRMQLTNSAQAPSIKDLIQILGVDETLNRLKKYI